MRPLQIIASLSFLFSSCSENFTQAIKIDTDKDIIPEGIAVSENQVFISSIFKNKIVAFDISQKSTSDFISMNEYGFNSGVGLFAKNNLLVALSNDIYSHPNKSYVFLFSIKEKRLIKEYELLDGQSHFLNDLTIKDDSLIFITDTRQHKIIQLDYAKGVFRDYLSDSLLMPYPNGITISDDNRFLFVASADKGLRIIDMGTKKYLNGIFNETKGIDGMKYYNGAIYAIKNGDRDSTKHGLIKITLKDDNSGIEKTEDILIGDRLMKVPTTLDIQENSIYMIANSQLNNLNQKTNQIIDSHSLTDTYILKVRIK
jgi:hypothetical protein